MTKEHAVEIRVMARRGIGIREMARELGCSRNTVRRYLKDPNATRYRGRPLRPVKLDPFKPYLLERVAAGQYNKVIAAELGISLSTVEIHRKRVMEKLQAESLSDLIRTLALANDGE